MAIDTRTKRQNAAHVGRPIGKAVLPSGTIDTAARAQIAWTYGGIAIGAPSAAVEQPMKIRLGTSTFGTSPGATIGSN